MNALEKMKLTKLLNQAVNERNVETNPLKKMGLVKQVMALRVQLGLVKQADQKHQISSFVENAISTSDNKLKTLKLSDVTSEEAAKIKVETGLDLTGFTHEIDNYSINHVLKQHGNPKKEESRGQVAITQADFTLIPDIVKNYDSIEHAGKTNVGRDAIKYVKRYDDTVYYVEEVRDGKKGNRLTMQTMYKVKGGFSQTSETFPTKDGTPSATPSFGDITPDTDKDQGSIPKTAVNSEDLFNYNPEGVTVKQRQNANNAAIEIVRKVQVGELAIDDITPEQKIILSTYSGSGGGLTTAEGTRGSSYEYYTPKPVAQGMWDLLKAMGFSGGRVLDPCAGTGIFSATAPQNALMESIELDKTSGTINRILFNDANHKVTISPFEAVATATEDEIVDAVITNVPFGDNRGGNQFKDSRYQNENLESYFILRSLDKLRPNGLAVFMSGVGIMSGSRYRKVRQQISLKAEFMGAYRLPNKLFEEAGADVVTDVLVFKKHSAPNKAIIDELAQTAPETLKNANVLWETFISGRYFKENPKFILGTETKVRSKYGNDILAVMSDDSISNIAKLLRRFEGSRIDWELLNATDAPIISYQEGETIYFDGVLKEYKNGAWQNVKTTEMKANIIDKIYIELEQYHSPLAAIEAKLDLARLLELVQQVKNMGLDTTRIPQWVRDVMIASQ